MKTLIRNLSFAAVAGLSFVAVQMVASTNSEARSKVPAIKSTADIDVIAERIAAYEWSISQKGEFTLINDAEVRAVVEGYEGRSYVPSYSLGARSFGTGR